MPRADWAFADCRTVAVPRHARSDAALSARRVRSAGLYELVYTAKDPLVLGIGLAATRDIVSFFRHASRDGGGTANPVAGDVKHVVAIGDSQSGNLIKTFVHLGFNEDLSRRIVWDGVFPRIAARQTPINFRFALPGGAATLYEPGSEPVVWWGRYRDTTRGRPEASLLDRCTASRTCPKIIEAFGSTEFWGLRMSPGLIGTDAARTFRCRPTCAATTIRARRMAAGAAALASRPGRRTGRLHAAAESQSGSRYHARADARADRVGDDRDDAPGQPLSTARSRGAGARDESRRRHSPTFRDSASRSLPSIPCSNTISVPGSSRTT